MRPEVRADIRLARHSSPYEMQLCLWPGAEEDWDWNTHYGSAGAYFLGRAVELLALQNNPAELLRRSEKVPDRQGRYFFGPAPGSLVFPDGVAGDVPPDSWGRITIAGLRPDAVEPHVRSICLVKSLEIFDRRGNQIETRTASAGWRGVFDPTFEFTGLWARSSSYPKFRRSREEFEQKFSRWVEHMLPRGEQTWVSLGGRPEQLRLLGVAFPEEDAWSEETASWTYQDDWVFVLERKEGNTVRRRTYRSFKVSARDWFARNPALVALTRKRCVIVGCGALGSLIATSLCRAGVGEFFLIDGDSVQPGNLVRSDYLLPDIGAPKVIALRDRLRMINPEVKVSVLPAPWGHMPRNPEATEVVRQMRTLVEAADVIVSAAADWGIGLDLQELAIAVQKPFVYADVNQGAWGGRAFSFDPRIDDRGCLGCLFYQLQTHQLPRLVASPAPLVMPDGCDSPTFIGASFDLEAMASFASRLAVQSMLHGEPDAYPGSSSNLILWQAVATEQSPTTSLHTITRHAECTLCGPR